MIKTFIAFATGVLTAMFATDNATLRDCAVYGRAQLANTAIIDCTVRKEVTTKEPVK